MYQQNRPLWQLRLLFHHNWLNEYIRLLHQTVQIRLVYNITVLDQIILTTLVKHLIAVDHNVQITVDHITVVDHIHRSHHGVRSPVLDPHYLISNHCDKSDYVDHINTVDQDVWKTLVEYITLVAQNMQITLEDHITVVDQNVQKTLLYKYYCNRSEFVGHLSRSHHCGSSELIALVNHITVTTQNVQVTSLWYRNMQKYVSIILF